MVIPQWGLSILTEVWREEKGGYYLAWSFPFTGREWPSTATSGHIKYLDESTCEYSVCVFTGGREGRKEGHVIYMKPLLHARHGAGCWQTSGWGEVRERKEVDMMEVFDKTESLFLLSWPAAAPVPLCFFFLSLHHLESPCHMSFRFCLDLPWVEVEVGMISCQLRLTCPLRVGGKTQATRGVDTEAGMLVI